MDHESNKGYIRRFTHNTEMQETRKTIKTGVFGLPRRYCEELLLDLDENWHSAVKNMFVPEY